LFPGLLRDRYDFSIGDLVVFLQNLEWNDITAIEGEIGIITEIFHPDDEVEFFDLQIQLADGGRIPVWTAEIERLESES